MGSVSNRHARILELLKEYPFLTYKVLADKVGVSAITIRRDVAKLEAMSQLKSAVGGVISAEYLDINLRLQERVAEKRRIGVACAELINPGQSLFIDAGSTTYYVLEALKGKPRITTIGYDLKHNSLLRDLPLAEHYLAGGQLHPGSNQMMGPLAEEFLNHFRVDVAVMGCTSLSSQGLLACNGSWEVPLKRMMLEHSSSRILVTDSSKFTREALLGFGDIRQFQTVITDSSPPDGLGRLFDANKIKVIIAPPAKSSTPAG